MQFRKICLIPFLKTNSSVSFSVAACVNMMTRSSWGITGASASACPEESMPARKSAPQLSTK